MYYTFIININGAKCLQLQYLLDIKLSINLFIDLAGSVDEGEVVSVRKMLQQEEQGSCNNKRYSGVPNYCS